MFYLASLTVLQPLLYISILVYCTFRFTGGSSETPTVYPILQQAALVVVLSVFMVLSLSLGPVPSLTSLVTGTLYSARPLIVSLLLLLLFFTSFWSSTPLRFQLFQVHTIVFLGLFVFFFTLAWCFSNHFEVLGLLEYLNSLLILYLLFTLPTPRPSRGLFSLSSSLNVRYLSHFFFIPALLNFFFIVFVVSIALFFFYVFFLEGVNVTLSFNDLGGLLSTTGFSGALVTLLLLNLGIAPIHLWKLELFESFRLTHLFFYSSLYLFTFIFLFEVLSLRLLLWEGTWGVGCLLFAITLTLIFIFSSLNTLLTLSQFLVASSLINLNLVLLTLLLGLDGTYPLFTLFNISYFLLITIFYWALTQFSPASSYLSSVRPPQGLIPRFVFFLVPLLGLSGAAPATPFVFKLLFLINTVNSLNFLVISLYIANIVFSILLYFQLLNTNLVPKGSNISNLYSVPTPQHVFYLTTVFLSLFLVLPLGTLTLYFVGLNYRLGVEASVLGH